MDIFSKSMLSMGDSSELSSVTSVFCVMMPDGDEVTGDEVMNCLVMKCPVVNW